MNVQIPIAGVTLSDDQTYDGQIPVWSTRPMMLRLLPDLNKPVNIIVREGGTLIKRITLPYQEIINFDLSFAAPLLRRADRNNSDGTPMFPQQMIEIWGANTMARIIIPVFHCDETYWDTLGVDSALPQPPKPRIPNQTLDIYFPYRINPSDALFLEVEPVTGAPSNVIFPATYVLGNTIDITYIKKLTIKNVWGNGLDQVINYEDRLMSDVVYDGGLQCALRARWNMRNGQWFWGAFKDYFWSNKFTPIRGRGGVTEQAEITINLEYGEEYYNVYQELLVSSNIVFDLNIPGINQYQSKRFRAEVVGDTGARWSNSTKTYRQQVRFKTTELQDNYIFPQQPDTPPTPAIEFSAQFNPWTVPAGYAEEVWNNIYSNAAWEVQSNPSWFELTNGTTLLTPDDFEQGNFGNYSPLTPPESWKTISANHIRLKKVINSASELYSLISMISGYQVQIYYVNSSGTGETLTGWTSTGIGRRNLAEYPGFLLVLRVDGNTAIEPNAMTTINMRCGRREWSGSAGTQHITGMVAANTGEARSGNLVLKSKAGSTTYTIPITQAKASISLSEAISRVPSSANASSGVAPELTSNTDWQCVEYPTWFVPHAVNGGAGSDIALYFTRQANTGASMRSANITYRSKVNPSVQASFRIEQAGATGNLSVDPPTLNVDYLTNPVTVDITSFGNWSVQEHDPWITPSVLEGWSGTTTVTLTIGDNLPAGASARTGTIRFYDHIAREFATVTVNQGGAPASIKILPSRVSGPKAGGNQIVPAVATSENNWIMGSAPSWVSVTPTLGGPGQTAIGVKYDTANPGAARTGQLRLENTTTHEIAICLITQEG